MFEQTFKNIDETLRPPPPAIAGTSPKFDDSAVEFGGEWDARNIYV